jgi:hypothetical protein
MVAGGNYQRLLALKNKYDHDNVFQLNQNVPPTKDATVQPDR